jgi:hypothetical protein
MLPSPFFELVPFTAVCIYDGSSRHFFRSIRRLLDLTYVEKLTVALGQNAWEAHVTSIDCLFEAGFADLAGT